MKKLFIMMATALTATVATFSFSSCSKEEPLTSNNNVNNAEQKTSNTVDYSVMFTADQKYMVDALMTFTSYVDKKSGNLVAKWNGKDPRVEKKNVSALNEVFKSINSKPEELDSLFKGMQGLKNVAITVRDAEDKVMLTYRYCYGYDIKELVGTYGATSEGKEYRLNVTDKKNDAGKYIATFTSDGTEISGSVDIYDNVLRFRSDEKLDTSYTYASATARHIAIFLFDSENTTTGKAKYYYYDNDKNVHYAFKDTLFSRI